MVHERLGVDIFDTGNELLREEDSLQRKLAATELEEVSKLGAELIEHQGVIVALNSEQFHEGNADAARE